MNSIKFAVLQYAHRLKFLLAFILVVWLIAILLKPYPISYSRSHSEPAYSAIYNVTMRRVMEYCNPAHTIGGDEGHPPIPGARLKMVVVVSRHGDRSPLRIVRDQMAFDCRPHDDPDFDSFVETVRHIGKTMTSNYPLHPLDTDCGDAGLLTLLGARQMLRLGQHFRRAYIDRHRLIDTTGELKEISCHSTSFPRTYQSAVAFIYGFVGGSNFTNVSIRHTKDYTFCSNDCDCDIVDVYHTLMVNKLDKLTSESPDMTNVFARLSPVVKIHPDQVDLTEPFEIFDALMAYMCHNHPLPCFKGECATLEDVMVILNHIALLRSSLPEAMVQKFSFLNMREFIFNVAYSFQKIRHGDASKKFLHYSGHDVTLEEILHAIGMHTEYLVPYASRLVFEVYKSGEQYLLKVLFNGKDVTNQTTFCRYFFDDVSSEIKGPCPLEGFEDFVENSEFLKVADASKTACRPV